MPRPQGNLATRSSASEIRATTPEWSRGHQLSALSPAAPLRILHILFSRRIAGSEKYCIDLANGQAALGHEVHVAGTYGSPIAGHLDKEVMFHGFRTPLFRSWALSRLIADRSADICHAHLSPACKALTALSGGVAKVATLHVGYKARQHARLDGLICVNASQMAGISGYAGQAKQISNWLPETSQKPATDLRRQLGLPPETRLIGSVGRLHPSKGNDVLIEAFLKAAPRDAALVIAGEGPHRAALEKLANADSRIRLIGHCDDVGGFLAGLDLFVSPSREESAGLAILEAMNEGLPVIATATEGPSEYLRDQPVAIVEPGSVNQLAAALSRAFQAAGVEGFSRLCYDMTPFSRTTGIDHVLQFYRSVMGADAGLRGVRVANAAGS